uniref:Uncharacterized protein n=1 Tax=Plectus sambesii TaxID=2011161 RepID=A0A914VU78_9BILA
MSDYRLRRARSMEIISRPYYTLRTPDPVTRVASVQDLSSMAAAADGYLYRRPYIYGVYNPPSVPYRRYYATEGLLTDPYPTYPRSYSAAYNYSPYYPTSYASYNNYYSPSSYRRNWATSYGLGSGYFTGRYHNTYGGLHSWERAFTRSYYRPAYYDTDYYCRFYRF